MLAQLEENSFEKLIIYHDPLNRWCFREENVNLLITSVAFNDLRIVLVVERFDSITKLSGGEAWIRRSISLGLSHKMSKPGTQKNHANRSLTPRTGDCYIFDKLFNQDSR
jgi:hypothetical protein